MPCDVARDGPACASTRDVDRAEDDELGSDVRLLTIAWQAQHLTVVGQRFVTLAPWLDVVSFHRGDSELQLPIFVAGRPTVTSVGAEVILTLVRLLPLGRCELTEVEMARVLIEDELVDAGAPLDVVVHHQLRNTQPRGS